MNNTKLRVAVVGAGPAGLYATGELLKNGGYNVKVDLYERLPTPWGLVRAGVAPDHHDKKLITDRLFDFFIENPDVCFFGNIEVGRDVSHEELSDWYDAVIYAVGASSDTHLNVPGEELSGCWAAREFVAWYNGHPDFSGLEFDLSTERAVIVGNGNVALDVARILTMPVAELEKTDIADHALAALRDSKVNEVVLLGRRGHLQGAFHNPELEELEHLQDVDVIVEAEGLLSDSDAELADADWDTVRKVETLRRLAVRPITGASKRIVLRFLASPVALQGNGKLEQLVVVRNALERDDTGALRARPTQKQSTVDTGLVLRAIGYRGCPFPGLPFDDRRGVIENHLGRVGSENDAVPGVYVTGWIKRGPKGVIGSNKKCARDTVRCLLEDSAAGKLRAASLDANAVANILMERKPDLIQYQGWKKIDQQERLAGQSAGRPRVKLTHLDAMTECALN